MKYPLLILSMLMVLLALTLPSRAAKLTCGQTKQEFATVSAIATATGVLPGDPVHYPPGTTIAFVTDCNDSLNTSGLSEPSDIQPAGGFKLVQNAPNTVQQTANDLQGSSPKLQDTANPQR